jgi:hypothetical protein
VRRRVKSGGKRQAERRQAQKIVKPGIKGQERTRRGEGGRISWGARKRGKGRRNANKHRKEWSLERGKTGAEEREKRTRGEGRWKKRGLIRSKRRARAEQKNKAGAGEGR